MRQRRSQAAVPFQLSLLLAVALAGPATGQTAEPPPEFEATDQQVVDRFAVQFMRPNARTVFENRWFGIPTQQNPNDIWITQEILWEQKPDLLVETGTFRGGSAALYATLLEQINPGARVVTIDIRDLSAQAKRFPIVKKRVDFLVGSSTAPEIVADVKARAQGKKVMVILDSLHTKEHVLGELRAYASLVPVGGYVLVQDSIANGHPTWTDFGPGPFEAIDAFLAENDAFEIDKDRERLMFTLHPNGYLKRIK